MTNLALTKTRAACAEASKALLLQALRAALLSLLLVFACMHAASADSDSDAFTACTARCGG